MTDHPVPPRPVTGKTGDEYNDDALARLNRFDIALHAVVATLKKSLDPDLPAAERDSARLVATQRANALEGAVPDLAHGIILIRAASGAVAASASVADSDTAFLADAEGDRAVTDAETIVADASLLRLPRRHAR